MTLIFHMSLNHKCKGKLDGSCREKDHSFEISAMVAFFRISDACPSFLSSKTLTHNQATSEKSEQFKNCNLNWATTYCLMYRNPIQAQD